MNSKEILGVRVDMGLDVNEAVLIIEGALKNESIGDLVCTTNPEFIMEAQRDSEFKDLVNSSILSVPDGIGVVAADYYLERAKELKRDALRFFKLLMLGFQTGFKTIRGDFNKQRITGVNLTEKLFQLSAEKKYSIFLLGGWPKNWQGKNMEMKNDFATLTAEVMEKKYPGVNIVGSTSKFSREKQDDENTVEFIHNRMKEKGISSIDILLVAYNQNKQERWVSRNSKILPAKISVGVGGTFDYLIGYYKQVPEIFTNMGLEWLFRLITQPFRIKRIFNAFPIFPFKVFLYSLKN